MGDYEALEGLSQAQIKACYNLLIKSLAVENESFRKYLKYFYIDYKRLGVKRVPKHLSFAEQLHVGYTYAALCENDAFAIAVGNYEDPYEDDSHVFNRNLTSGYTALKEKLIEDFKRKING